VLPKQGFDCIIFTQTLQFIFDMAAAIDQLHGALRPGGALLVSVPGITPVGQGEWGPYWLWSLTQTALSCLLSGPFDADNVTVRTYGNLAAATAFLHAAAVEEVGHRRLVRSDPAYPVTVTARAVA
jgi:SAM-dependent methyltransferase